LKWEGRAVAAEAAVAALTSELSMSRQEAKRYEEEARATRVMLEITKDERDNLLSAGNSLKDKLQISERVVRDLESRIADMERSLKDRSVLEERDSLRARVKSLEEQLEAAKADSARLAAAKKSLDGRLRELELFIKEVEKKLTEASNAQRDLIEALHRVGGGGEQQG
jgi:chromosome segregation ATPase